MDDKKRQVALQLVAALNISFRRTTHHSALEEEAQGLIDDVFRELSNQREQGPALDYDLAFFSERFGIMTGLSGLKLAPETEDKWTQFTTFSDTGFASGFMRVPG
ncbi:hypothetical protein PQ472_02785 [Lacticaseibacillus pabuli]|uniref:Uncharacterized protein n=1 Tax=Lacticaseibacillus pabuli TaxID=3025672 RepID=A0ABY7WTR0_9LACO|nr:hypothetical protein [Lacticaseibacillus sp. KACC 23028]WDF83179.1 hypothetical protein PQ472_02785 [Lacticaseibacillus sp. KACC 23028]